MQVVSCTCDFVYTFCRWCCVYVVLCTCYTYGTSVHVVLCACHTYCVVGIQYYVCALCIHGIMTCVFIVLYFVYVYLLCRTPGVGVCMYFVVSYNGCRCMYVFFCVIHRV